MFAGKVSLDHPWPEYPRPQLQRDHYFSLNGLWEYQINHGENPEGEWKKILVPFAAGTRLSGCKEVLQPTETLWYRKRFAYQPNVSRILLHFEAVDQICKVYVNGVEAGEHHGGYCPFTFDVTGLIKEENEIVLKVTDDTDTGIYAYGKQKLEHGGMWYTPMSGIWGTVWMENLPSKAVTDIKITPDCANGYVYLSLAGTFTQAVITVFAGNQLVFRGATATKEYKVPMENYHAWSCDDPFLYTLYIQTEEETVKSYFAMRSFSKIRLKNGNCYFGLNGRPLFLTGLLDQGFSYEGGYTYPGDEAMICELKLVKSLGFNMLRKHIKVESRRWYYHCDRLGILVMQDMPSGGHPYDFKRVAVLPNIGFTKFDDGERAYEKNGRGTQELRKAYYEELGQMLDMLYNTPCIFAWVPFNEGWGQFDAEEVTRKIRAYDTTRLVDATSGWFDQGCGDFQSKHCYFKHFHAGKADGRILFLSEFGGYTYVENGHSNPKKVYGYKKFDNRLAYSQAVLQLYQKDVLENIPKGLAGCIYTELKDIEDECNGILSADMRIVKVDEKAMRSMNERCIRSLYGR